MDFVFPEKNVKNDFFLNPDMPFCKQMITIIHVNRNYYIDVIPDVKYI